MASELGRVLINQQPMLTGMRRLAQRPLLEVKRTWRGLVSMSANDPKRKYFALTAEAETKRPDASLIELLLGRSVIGSR